MHFYYDPLLWDILWVWHHDIERCITVTYILNIINTWAYRGTKIIFKITEGLWPPKNKWVTTIDRLEVRFLTVLKLCASIPSQGRSDILCSGYTPPRQVRYIVFWLSPAKIYCILVIPSQGRSDILSSGYPQSRQVRYTVFCLSPAKAGQIYLCSGYPQLRQVRYIVFWLSPAKAGQIYCILVIPS